jgi:hypothetical protein
LRIRPATVREIARKRSTFWAVATSHDRSWLIAAGSTSRAAAPSRSRST